MKPNEYTLRTNSFNFPRMLWLLVVLLLTIIVATEWLLRLQFPHQDHMFINMLTFLSILNALCILSVGMITERVTIGGNRLSQKVLLSVKSITFDNSVVIAPHKPSVKNGKPQAYQLLLKDATGTEIVLDASRFPRENCIAIAEYLSAKLATASVAADALPEVERILALWKNPTSSKIKTASKYLLLITMLGILGVNVGSVVPNALNIYNSCNQIRTSGLATRAVVKNIDLKYHRQGFQPSKTYVLFEYQAKTIAEATIIYADVEVKMGETTYTPTLRASGATPQDRMALYEKLKSGSIQVLYSPQNPAFAVLAGPGPSDYNVCNL